MGTPYRISGLQVLPQIHPPDVVAGIAARILDQVLLVIFLGVPELPERHDLGDDAGLPFPRAFHGADDFLGGAFLFLIDVENR